MFQFDSRQSSISSSDLQQLFDLVRKFQGEPGHRLNESARSIVDKLFGSQSQKGMLEKLHAEAIMHSPVEWAEKMDDILELVGPQSLFVRRLLDNRDIRVGIQRSLVPQRMFKDKDHSLNEEFRVIDIFYSSQTLTAPIFDWYFINFAYYLCNMNEIDRNIKTALQSESDDFHFQLTRNPFLMLLARYLESFSSHSNERRRLSAIMEAYLMGDLTAKGMNTARYYSGGNGRTIVKYQLRSVHLYAVYLLIHWRKDNCEIFYEYFDSLTENYTAYNNSSSEKNLRLLIRTWLYLIHRRSSIENDLIDSLHKANKQVGWYNMALYSLSNFQESIMERDHDWRREQNMISKIRANIIKLIKREANWVPSLLFSHTLQCFVCADELRRKEGYRDQLSEDVDVIKRAMNRIVKVYGQQRGRVSILLPENRHLKSHQSQLKEADDAKHNDSFSTWNTEATERRNCVTYCDSRSRSCWDYPIQYNEAYVLYFLFYFIAKQIDRVIPGQRRQPWLNIRFMANYVFWLLLIAVVVLVMLFKPTK